MTASPPLKTAIVYPDSDGAPMAESDPARDYLLYSVGALKLHFQNRDDVYVSGNLFIYYQQGVPSAVIAPDVFVIFGVANRQRMSYKAWQENDKLPDFILEVTSRTTQAQDEQDKPIKYARLGVTEYFQYDPSGDYLKPRLKGSRLVEGKYEPIESTLVNDIFSIHSSTLGLDLRLIDGELRFYDPNIDKYLPNFQEMATALQEAAIAREQAENARREAENARREADNARREAENARREADNARREAIPRLQNLGLSSEQIASVLNLSIEDVEAY